MLNVLVVSLLWVAYANGNPSDDSEVAGPVVVLPRSPSPTAGNHTGEEHPTPSDPTLKSLVKEVAREVDTALLKVNDLILMSTPLSCWASRSNLPRGLLWQGTLQNN